MYRYYIFIITSNQLLFANNLCTTGSLLENTPFKHVYIFFTRKLSNIYSKSLAKCISKSCGSMIDQNWALMMPHDRE